VLAGAGFLGMATWSEDPTFVELTLPLLVAGLGFGLVIAPINAAVMEEALEDQRATLASLLTVIRLVGALVGVALLTTRGLSGFYSQAGLIPLDDPEFESELRSLQVDSFRDTFLVTAAVCFATLIPAFLLGRSKR
jgi:MFS family permease